jgi:polyphosphate kinase
VIKRRQFARGSGARSVRSSPARFLNRELSWLAFDRRVLELASDRRVPLLERVKLCGIVSSNLDEFFAVRIADIQRRIRSGTATPSPDGRTPAQTLEEAREAIEALQTQQEALWLNELRPGLAAEGIEIKSIDECRPRELRLLHKKFETEIAPLLTPIAVGPSARFPKVHSLALNIGLIVKDFESTTRFVRINMPDELPRFVKLGDRGTWILLEDAILHLVPTILGDRAIEAAGVFRITRDAELSVAQHTPDLLTAVERELLHRRFGPIVRLEISATAGAEIVRILEQQLGLDSIQTYTFSAPLALSALIDLAKIERPRLKHADWEPRSRRTFGKRSSARVLGRIRTRDVLVHHPYDSFETSVQAFVDAARDSKVAGLKFTVYRTGDPSPTLASLVKTAEEDKQAVALVELKARFDERCNIEWARALSRAGVDVVYGAADLKLHAKLALLIRHERGRVRRYVHIGTGNYHASNASNYEDLSLFTADDAIAADVADIFNAVTSQTRPTPFRKLLVGPWYLRDGLLREIERVTHGARAGESARIRIKVNALVDTGIVDALYTASSAGVEIELITRGICTLRPAEPGLSERITVRSVLGRFLEHSRIFWFQCGDQTTAWIGSADLMPRNLDRRIEVLAPIDDPRHRAELATIFDALIADTKSSWELLATGAWTRRRPSPGTPAVSAQETLMASAAGRTKTRRNPPLEPTLRAA